MPGVQNRRRRKRRARLTHCARVLATRRLFKGLPQHFRGVDHCDLSSLFSLRPRLPTTRARSEETTQSQSHPTQAHSTVRLPTPPGFISLLSPFFGPPIRSSRPKPRFLPCTPTSNLNIRLRASKPVSNFDCHRVQCREALMEMER